MKTRNEYQAQEILKNLTCCSPNKFKYNIHNLAI